MALRLILVGVVAGLGLNLPVRESVKGWKRSAETWVYSRLAEWDARMPTGENAFVVVAEPTAPSEDAFVPTPNPAPVTLPTPAPVAAATVSAPTPNEAELAEGLDVPMTPVALDEPAQTSAPKVPTLTDADFDSAMDAVLADLAADLRATEAERRLAIAPVVVDDLFEGFAYALQRDAEGWNVALEAAAPMRPVPRFEPMEVGEDLYPGIAFALNREAEGLRHDPAPPSSGEPTDSRNRLTQAVRLTREAVQAWANLLHGPAVVVITH